MDFSFSNQLNNNVMREIEQLIEISRFYGKDKRFVIAGGGNTSYKDDRQIWVKASGFALATIDRDGFAVLDREKLRLLSEKSYSDDTDLREAEVKSDLEAACITKNRRPSVETSMHNAINYAFVVHLHPTAVNGLMCSRQAESKLRELFGDEHLYIPYTDPGYVLFKKVEEAIAAFRAKRGKEPSVIWLQNHGIFVAADNIEEIRRTYDHILAVLDKEVKTAAHGAVAGSKALQAYLQPEERPVPGRVIEILPALRMLVSETDEQKRLQLKTLKIRNNKLIEYYCEKKEHYIYISRPFTPDGIVYCKSNQLYIDKAKTEDILDDAKKILPFFRQHFGYQPKVIALRGLGIVAVGDNAAQCDTILDVFEDCIKIAAVSEAFGGPHPMTQEQIDFIDHWEVENYRRSIAAGALTGRAQNKTIVVTGAAQGFGQGIADELLKEGANIVVADLNSETGLVTVDEFNQKARSNRAVFVQTDVSKVASIEQLVYQSICCFGGIDCFISNAGILRAGGLEEMSPENFDLVTKINYNAYFYCTKVVSRVMKLQTAYGSPDYYADIIQINSKSGLRGSRANFAYAGGKFGGIGLTQSFALELAPFRIKVNSICPGNYYEGPLWSNPENGLFVQYLKAGKVPGAKTIRDVEDYYLAQVPMRKGCSPLDVSKGVLYLMDQCGETGQALPITGGQVMLN